MRIKRLNAARSVADRLFAAELALDLAVTKIAELNAALPRARLDANISAIVGQNALESSAAAMLLVARTREQIVMTHSRLKLASVDIGLGEVSFGDALKAPPAMAAPAQQPRLRVA
jgi:hypothetical protein